MMSWITTPMRMVTFSALLLAALAAPALAQSTGPQGSGPVGRWLTEGGKSQVEIARCGDKLCGRIVWLNEPLDETGKPKTDKNNPAETERSRPILGLQLLAGFIKSAEAADRWEDGTIYNPEDGKVYKCTLTLQDANTLKVRGYVGVPLFGKTQVWTRAP